MAKKPIKPHLLIKIRATEYLQAAQEHTAALPILYSNGDYGLTIYVSGLAAECLFRAFRSRRGMPFRSDHPLISLAQEAGFPELAPANHRERFDAALTDVVLRWRNSHRYRSNEAMRRYLKSSKLDRGIKGDFVKENARLISSSTIELINLGVSRWR